MKVGIYYHKNTVDPAAPEVAQAAFRRRGVFAAAFSEEEEIANVDRLLVLGGDGAVLRAARTASIYDIPLLGVNYGHLGFLTEFEREELEDAVRLLSSENCKFVRRTMLEAELCGIKQVCLNELTILRRIAPDSEDGVVQISITLDGSPAGNFAADGLIVCTPTGSTAYSLSAGGSILTPDCGAFLLTPVNAFSMRSRPIVFSDKSEIGFSLTSPGKAVLHGDGIFLGEIARGDRVSVKKSARCATFVTKEKTDFFRRLTEKIN